VNGTTYGELAGLVIALGKEVSTHHVTEHFQVVHTEAWSEPTLPFVQVTVSTRVVRVVEDCRRSPSCICSLDPGWLTDAQCGIILRLVVGRCAWYVRVLPSNDEIAYRQCERAVGRGQVR
jgi:hypothetical protein